MALKLSDLNPNDVQIVDGSPDSLKLSKLNPGDYTMGEMPDDPAKSPITTVTTGLAKNIIPFGSAIAGGSKAAMNALTGITGPLAGGSLHDVAEDYRNSRDAFDKDADVAYNANPKLGLGTSILASVMNPVLGSARTLGERVAAGVTQSLGNSRADLTQGEYGKAASDAAFGGVKGVLAHGAAETLPLLKEDVLPMAVKAATAAAAPVKNLVTHAVAAKLGIPYVLTTIGKKIINSISEDVAEKMAEKAGAPLAQETAPAAEAVKELVKKRLYDPFTKQYTDGP